MNYLNKAYNKIIRLKLSRNLAIILFISLSFDFLFFPVITEADYVKSELENVPAKGEIVVSVLADEKTEIIVNDEEESGKIRITDALPIKKIYTRTITAYNSEAAQCDSSPCITANGFNVCAHGKEDTIAANFLPFGAKVRIPDLFGDRVFTVRDRMNSRYYQRVDVWMVEKEDAKHFGVKLAKIEVLAD
ncbi:MAG: hypothetical protein PHT51_00590 [Patescibacteria group bacterium]|nr:hypothetical protein [Patescibacteria group bacterium]MDD4610733.1 hypothetical protein [Patescibacteria group bacterium]